jgi:soluble lytic murein transglycosylase-like protein
MLTMTRRARLYLCLIALLPCWPAVADIYSFVDDTGTTHFTNVPSDGRYRIFIVAAAEATEAGERVTPAFVIAGALRYEQIIASAASRTKVEPALLHAVIAVESGYNYKAVSRAGARGLMQLMPATARHYGVHDAFDPSQNIHAGARYLADLKRRYANNLNLVLAAYNAGEAAVDKRGSIPPFAETRRYVPRVMGIYNSLLHTPEG